MQGYLGASYELPFKVAPGIEFRSSTRLLENQTSLSLGPALAFRTSGWWVATTFSPRLTTFAPVGDVVIDDQPWEYRLLLGFHL